MIFSFETSLMLDNALRKQNIYRDKTLLSSSFCFFSLEELSKITSLEIRNTTKIDELVHLPNLKELKIISADRDKIYDDETPLELSTAINHIKDFRSIGKIKTLETLIIDNDINLVYLDVSELTNLKVLALTNNPNFIKIKGLDELTKLQSVIIYGNNLEGDIDIEKYMKNTLSTKPNILDIKLYGSMVRKNPDISRTISDYFLCGSTYVKFAERNGFMKLSILNDDNLEEMLKKLSSYFKKMNAYSMDDYSKLYLIYSYICKNISFAGKELQETQKLYRNLMNESKEVPEYLQKRLAALHNSYYAYHFKSANCEGVANLMAIMCDMLSIRNATVHCIDKRSKQADGTNHAMLRVEIEDEFRYLDPTFSISHPEDYFLVGIDKLEKDHQISSYEKLLCKNRKN